MGLGGRGWDRADGCQCRAVVASPRGLGYVVERRLPGAFQARRRNDSGPANPTACYLLNLQYPLSLLLRSTAGAHLLTLGLAAAAGGATLWLQRRNTDRRGKLLTYSLIAVWGLLAVHNHSYGAALLVLPLAWAFQTLPTPDRPLAVLTILFSSPLCFPGVDIFDKLFRIGWVSQPVYEAWWWRTFVMPHRVYALVAVAACLFCAAWRRAHINVSDDGSPAPSRQPCRADA